MPDKDMKKISCYINHTHFTPLCRFDIDAGHNHKIIAGHLRQNPDISKLLLQSMMRETDRATKSEKPQKANWALMFQSCRAKCANTH